jgi:Na+-driven multidrug efflux pump
MSKLLTNSISGTMIKMAIPMLAGTFAMNMYNLTNAYFVSRLGTDPLAAISFTFPVIILLMFLTRGLGTGAMTLVAHAIGGKDMKNASIMTSHAILLSTAFAIIMSIIGILTIKPLFTRLGATGEVLDLTVKYMQIWYLGAVIMVVQMTTSDILIGTGNTKAISFLMVGGTVVNVLLDIGLIFGKFGMPRMGIMGAAVATLISQAVSLSGAMYILGHRMKLIDFSRLKAGPVFKSLKKNTSLWYSGGAGNDSHSHIVNGDYKVGSRLWKWSCSCQRHRIQNRNVCIYDTNDCWNVVTAICRTKLRSRPH